MDSVTRVEPRMLARLASLDDLFTRTGVGYALIGATAILLHGVALPRTTRDLDFVVSVERDIEDVRPHLEARGLRSATIRHRFVADDGLEIDVLPVRVGESAEAVRLPGGESISPVGLAETISAAESIALPDGTVRVAPLALLTAIKLHVASVRIARQDLDDALALLSQYESQGLRRFEIDYVSEAHLTWDTAGAWLAGCDAQLVLQQQSRVAIVASLTQLFDDVRLTDRYAGGLESRALLTAFAAGLERALRE